MLITLLFTKRYCLGDFSGRGGRGGRGRGAGARGSRQRQRNVDPSLSSDAADGASSDVLQPSKNSKSGQVFLM